MDATASPDPFPPDEDFTITVSGGTPPYTYWAVPSPPNPQGVEVDPNGATADVSVPPNTPSTTRVEVEVTDSSDPPQTVAVNAYTQ